MMDTRNVIDEFKNVPQQEIIHILDQRGVTLEIAIENLARDYNMGTIVRNANAFGVRTVHVIGSKQWNKRGAMMTDTYLHVVYHKDIDEFARYSNDSHKVLLAIDIVSNAAAIHNSTLPKNAVLVFGAEGPGLSTELLELCEKTYMIEQHGSTRSINVGVASGIAMYEWTRQHGYKKPM